MFRHWRSIDFGVIWTTLSENSNANNNYWMTYQPQSMRLESNYEATPNETIP